MAQNLLATTEGLEYAPDSARNKREIRWHGRRRRWSRDCPRWRSGWPPAAAAPAARTAIGGDSGRRRSRSIKLVAAEYSADHTKAFWDQFAKTYKQKYGIDLNVQIISWDDIAQQSTTMVQNNNAPDILNINYYSSYAKDNLLYSADDVLPSSVQSDLLDSFKTSGTFNGKLYGFPDLSSARALFYNKTLFSKAGISQPADHLGRVRGRRQEDHRRWATASSATPSRSVRRRPRPSSRSGPSTTAVTGRTPAATGRSTATRTCRRCSFLKKLAVTDKVTQNNPGKTNRTDGAFPLFENGKAGMIVGFGPLSATLDKDKKVDYGIAPMPYQNVSSPQTYGVTDYLDAFKKPGNQEAVKDFYELYYQPDQVNTLIKSEGFLPVTKSGPGRLQVRRRRSRSTSTRCPTST